MLELIQSNLGAVAGLSSGVVVAWLLKRIPNDKIQSWVGGIMFNAGVDCSAGMGKWKFTKGIWNKTIEPYFIDAIDNILVNGIASFVKGLRSDNG